MDEAFSALDPLIRREMQDELLELQAKFQKTIIFVSHDLNEALRIGDRIAIMKDGKIMSVFSKIVRCGNRPKFWKTILIVLRRT